MSMVSYGQRLMGMGGSYSRPFQTLPLSFAGTPNGAPPMFETNDPMIQARRAAVPHISQLSPGSGTMYTPKAISQYRPTPWENTGVSQGQFNGQNAVEAARAAQAQRQAMPPPGREPGMGGSVINGYMRG